MSEENSASGDGKKTIKVDVVLTEEIKNLMRKNLELEQKVEQQNTLALELFEAKKNEAIRNFPAYAKVLRECTTPETLEKFVDVADSAQSKESGYVEPTENKGAVVSGKAQMSNPNFQGDQYEGRTALVDHLYDVGYYNCQRYTKQEQEDARNKIDTLFQSLANSKSMEELKRRPALLGEMMKQHSLSECPKCHATLDNTDVCPACKYDSANPKMTKDGYVFVGPEWPETKERERMKRKS